MRAISILCALIALAGCVQAPVAPNLKLPDCKKLAMPAIPEHVELVIDGDEIKADAGGKLLLRNYVEARKLLR